MYLGFVDNVVALGGQLALTLTRPSMFVQEAPVDSACCQGLALQGAPEQGDVTEVAWS